MKTTLCFSATAAVMMSCAVSVAEAQVAGAPQAGPAATIQAPSYTPGTMPTAGPTPDDFSFLNHMSPAELNGLNSLTQNSSSSPAEYNKAICALLLFWCTIGDDDACRLYRKYNCPG